MATTMPNASHPLSLSPGDTYRSSLQLEGVTFGYSAGAPVIDGLTASLPAGRFCVLAGPNAAGKSTLLRLLMGQLLPWQGEVLLDGKAIRRHPVRRRARLISYVPQHGAAAFPYTVDEVVGMGLDGGAAPETTVGVALEACGLAPLRHRIFNTLSSGQQQRAMLARAVAQAEGEGRYMLLDEPVSAMDVAHVHRAMALLRGLVTSGLGVLAVLHDIGLAARYADDVWLMDRGRIVATGPWDEVLTAERLEPVYGIRLERIETGENRRPMYYADGEDTMPP